MHSVSDHSLNIPSKSEVDKYVSSLSKSISNNAGIHCSSPMQHRHGNATASAIAFGRSAILMLSLAPKGMEDIPQQIRKDLELYSAGLGLDLLLVDCHNAMGAQLNSQDKSDLLIAAKGCLDDVSKSTQAEFSVGFASLEDLDEGHHLKSSHDLGQSGLAVIAIRTQGRECSIGWSDSNNMDNALRDKVVAKAASENISLLEVCSSDTHSTSGKRTSEGYFPLGAASDQDRIADAFSKMCKMALERASLCTYEVSYTRSKVKVMGEKQFQDYSGALDSAMNITKAFVGITVAVFIAMQVLA